MAKVPEESPRKRTESVQQVRITQFFIDTPGSGYYIGGVAKIGIIGHGYVGKAADYGFRPKNEIMVHDKYLPSLSLAEVAREAEIIFICVPTPMNSGYTQIDLSIVEEVVENTTAAARSAGAEPILVVKSTVVPGTTRSLAKKYSWPAMLFNPEFLTEANYLWDFVNSDRIVVGGDLVWVRQKLVDLYRESFPMTKIFQTDPTTAEMVKYMANTYLATKVIFANEMYSLSEKLGVKYEEVKEMTVADRRIFDSHLDVTSQRGFGGKCFPKDLVALLGLGQSIGADMKLLQTVWEKNLSMRQVRDWEDIPGAVTKNGHEVPKKTAKKRMEMATQ